MKNFIRERQVKIQKEDKDESATLKEKELCFWNKAQANRESNNRIDIEELIPNYLNNPSKYKTSNSFGVKKYLKQMGVEKY